MSFFFGNRFAKKQKIAGQERYFDRTYYLQNNIEPKWSSRNYETFAEEGYIKNVIAHRAISMISNAVSSITPLFFEITDNSNKSELADNDNICLLIKRPNPTTNYMKFMEYVVSSYLISGNVFIQAVKNNNDKIAEMYLLRSDRVSVIAGYGNIPSGYKYKINNMSFFYPCDEENGKSDILHIKAFNPLDDWYGLSPMECAQYSIDQHNECVKWNKALLENGARPSGALVVKQSMTDEVYNRLKSEMDEKFRGGENAGKFLLLEGGLEWKEMGISPKDMDFIETKNASARDIASAFGVPSQLLGIKGDNTYNNVAEARLSFWEDTIIPLAKMIMSSFADWLSITDGRKLIIEPDIDSINALTEKRQKVWDSVNNSNFVSNEEKRETLGFNGENKI